MNSMKAPLFLLLAASTAQAAQVPVLWAGYLQEDGIGVDRTVTATFTVNSGASVVSERVEAALPVVDGDFVVELLVDELLEQTLSIVIDGVDLGATPLPLDWPQAAFANSADTADTADRADRVGDIDDPLSLQELDAGAVPVALANVSDFPAAFLDGDQGLAFTPSSSFTFANGSLGIATGGITAAHLGGTFPAADLAPNAITNADFKDNGVSANVATAGSIPLTRVAAAAVTSRHLGGSPDRQTVLFEVTRSDCDEPQSSLTLQPTCSFQSSQSCVVQVINGQPVNGHVSCDGTCLLGSRFNCPNTAAGKLVFR